jgi:hypothetical protein
MAHEKHEQPYVVLTAHAKILVFEWDLFKFLQNQSVSKENIFVGFNVKTPKFYIQLFYKMVANCKPSIV